MPACGLVNPICTIRPHQSITAAVTTQKIESYRKLKRSNIVEITAVSKRRNQKWGNSGTRHKIVF